MNDILNNEEKLKLMFFCLITYEKLDDFLEEFLFQSIRDIYNHDKVLCENVKKYHNFSTLKKEHLIKIAKEIEIISEDDCENLKTMSNIRDMIAHEPWIIYFDETITLDYFKLDIFIKTHKDMVIKIYNKLITDDEYINRKHLISIYKNYNKNISPSIIYFYDLFKDKKFDKYRQILMEPIEFEIYDI